MSLLAAEVSSDERVSQYLIGKPHHLGHRIFRRPMGPTGTERMRRQFALTRQSMMMESVPMSESQKPGSRALGRVSIYIAALFAFVFLVVFFGRNIWHGKELSEDQATGQNLTNTHDRPSYDAGRD